MLIELNTPAKQTYLDSLFAAKEAWLKEKKVFFEQEEYFQDFMELYGFDYRPHSELKKTEDGLFYVEFYD